MAAADSYMGCFISLISKAEIRYEGSLFHINTQESTIGLRNVKSFGSEGRRKDGSQVLPSDKVYEYIFFRGSDIKDLQVISSPPVESTTALPNDPAIIIQPHYPHSTSASSSFPSATTVPATNISYSAQLGLPNSTFQGNLPLDQPMGSLGSWDPFPPPSENGNGIAMPTYWSGHAGSSGRISHLQQQSSLQPPPQILPLFPQVQQQMQNSTLSASLPDTSSSAEFSSPMLPTVGTSPPSLISTMPPPPALPSSALIRQSATLPSKLSPNLMPKNSDFPLASPLAASSLGMNPILPSVMDKPRLVCQTTSQSAPPIGGLSSPVHHEASIPSLLTPGQLLHPGLTGQSLQHFQTVHKDIEVVQASTSDSLSLNSESAKNSTKSFPSPSADKLNNTALYTHQSEKDHTRGKGNWLNGSSLRNQHSYRAQARGRAKRVNGAALYPHQSNRIHSWGRENGPNTDAVRTHRSGWGRTRGCARGWGKGNETSTAVQTHHSYRGRGRGKGNQVSPTINKFTEDFDFEAMNEKFNKEEIWGHLGRSNKPRLEDNEGDGKENDADDTEEEEDGLLKPNTKPFYVKDDFFDSLSCNSLNHESERLRPKLSEQRRIDIETFGKIPRRGRGRSSWGPNRGRGYGYVGRGRDRTVWSRVT